MQIEIFYPTYSAKNTQKDTHKTENPKLRDKNFDFFWKCLAVPHARTHMENV